MNEKNCGKLKLVAKAAYLHRHRPANLYLTECSARLCDLGDVILQVVAKPSDHGGSRNIAAACVHRYLVYGIVVESEFRLNSVDDVCETSAEASIRISLASPDSFRRRARGLPADPDDWIQHAVLPDGGVYMKLEGMFETLVSADGRAIACARLGDADARSFEANLLNFALSAALTLRGEEPLHATVLDVDGAALGLLGDSGTGKSTLAAALIGQGAQLITDDMLRLTFADGVAFAHHGPHRLKLFDEPARRLLPRAMSCGHFNALSGKLMMEPGARAPARHQPRPLSALFWLGEPQARPTSDDVSATRLAGTALIRVLTASTGNSRNHTPDRLARQLRFAERVAQSTPVYALCYARRYALLDRVVERIRQVVARS